MNAPLQEYELFQASCRRAWQRQQADFYQGSTSSASWVCLGLFPSTTFIGSARRVGPFSGSTLCIASASRSANGCFVVPIQKLQPVCRAFAAHLPLPVLKVLALCLGQGHKTPVDCLYPPKLRILQTPSEASAWAVLQEKPALPHSTALGRVASLQVGQARRLVVLASFELVPDCAKMASSIESDRRFSSGCWWAARAFHRARRLGNSSEYAEVLGSFLSRLWDPVSGLPTGGLVERLTIKASGFRGDGTGEDDHLVHAVCKAIKGSPLVKRAPRKRTRAEDMPEARALRRLRHRRVSGHIPGPRLIHTTAGGIAIASASLTPRTVTAWTMQARQQRSRYDGGRINAEDRELLHRFQAKPASRVSLPAVPLSRKQAEKFSKLAPSDKKKVINSYLKRKGDEKHRKVGRPFHFWGSSHSCQLCA